MLTAGVDEVGRGPLIGPVVAAAVILPKEGIEGLRDSKKLSEKKREQFAEIIREKALSWSIAEVSSQEIDTLNIHHATLLAMKRAILGLCVTPEMVLVDGKFCPDVQVPCQAIIKGDSSEPEISAASILAKVYRDDLMIQLGKKHPHYGFESHKGYPTKVHLHALNHWGVLPEHRRSYKPVFERLV